MSIDRDEVEHIAQLARIDLEEDEVEQFSDELSAILAYVDKLEELDTEGVEPMTHAGSEGSRMRGDDPEQSLSREDVLNNAAESEDGQFRVPKVVE